MEKDLIKSQNLKEKISHVFKQPLVYVILICIFVQIKIYNTVPNYVMTSDSYTYAEEYTGSVFKGQVSALRTPVYPYVIKLIGKIAGQENAMENVAIFQKLLFVITLILFYFCLKKITKSSIITSVLTIVFGICPFIILWNIMILTEAVSIFESVLLSFITISYLQKPRKSTAILTGIIILAMIMTRPSFLYLLPIYILFWILRWLFNIKEKEVISGLVSCGICIVVLLGYCGLMKAQHGEFSITAVSYINNTVTVINSNSYKNADNKEMVAMVDEIKGDTEGEAIAWKAYNALREKYSVEELKKFASSAMKNDKNYISFLIKKTLNLGTYSIGTSAYIPDDVMIDNQRANIVYAHVGNLIMPINFGIVYVISLIAIIYLIYDMFKNAKINWYIAFFTVLIIANIFTLIVGAPFESQRLFASSIVQVVLLVGYLISKGLEKDKEANKEQEVDEENNMFYKLFLEKTNDGKIQFFRYLFVGGFAAVVNIGSLYVFKETFKIYYLVANVLGFILGLVTNYLLSKWLVFAKEDSMNGIAEFTIYVLIGILGLGFDTLFVWLFTDKIGLYFMISKIASTLLVFIWNFFARKGMYAIANKLRKDK